MVRKLDPLAFAVFRERLPDGGTCRARLGRARVPGGPACTGCGAVDRTPKTMAKPRRGARPGCDHRLTTAAGAIP